MSRGRGSLQRRLLAVLSEALRSVDTFELAALAYELEPDANGHIEVTDSQLASVKRALASLARDGAVVPLFRKHPTGRKAWTTPEHAAAYSNDRARSNRHFANEIGVHHATVGAARKRLEAQQEGNDE
jgi:hypothetical protein